MEGVGTVEQEMDAKLLERLEDVKKLMMMMV